MTACTQHLWSVWQHIKRDGRHWMQRECLWCHVEERMEPQ